MPPFRIQFAGNLFVDHTHEHWSKLLRPNNTPYLALLGNIGNPFNPATTQFLDYCSQHWDRIFWIAGPHELGHAGTLPYTFRQNMDAMDQIASKRPKFQIMNQTACVVDGVQLLGVTLWTPVHSHLVKDKYAQPEFQTIQKYKSTLTPIDLMEWHTEDITFLERNLDRTPTVILTHHLPHPSLLSPSLRIPTWNRMGMLTTNLGHLLVNPCKLWLSGASGGSSIGLFRNQTLAMVNSLHEYPHDRKAIRNVYYNPTLYAELDTQPPVEYSVTHGVPPQEMFSQLR